MMLRQYQPESCIVLKSITVSLLTLGTAASVSLSHLQPTQESPLLSSLIAGASSSTSGSLVPKVSSVGLRLCVHKSKGVLLNVVSDAHP